MTSDVAKDLLGLIGGILALVPFLRDFAQRRSARWWREIAHTIPGARRATEPIAEEEENKLKAPSAADILCVMVGILFLTASFAVSLYHSIGVANGAEGSLP